MILCLYQCVCVVVFLDLSQHVPGSCHCVCNGMMRRVFAGARFWIADSCVSTTMQGLQKGGDDTVEEVDE